MKSLIFYILKTCSPTHVEKFVDILWNLWRRRNELNNIFVQFTFQNLLHWKTIHGRCKYNNPKPASTRKLQQGTPTLEYVKCNVDAAIFHDACSFGGGCCLQDSTGHFIRANTNWYQGIPTPQVAESSSLLAAISWAFEIHLQNIIFKTDCKANVDVLARKISQTQKQG
ncbi:hypothetical protein GmHk_03G007389 [Glycine max]|nr:hypothetical protein GmHk_03G007389 [Glycine max]